MKKTTKKKRTSTTPTRTSQTDKAEREARKARLDELEGKFLQAIAGRIGGQRVGLVRAVHHGATGILTSCTVQYFSDHAATTRDAQYRGARTRFFADEIKNVIIGRKGSRYMVPLADWIQGLDQRTRRPDSQQPDN